MWKNFLTSVSTHTVHIDDNGNTHFGSEAIQNQLTYDLGYAKKGLLKKNAVPTIATPAETLTHTVSIPNYLDYLFFHINENVDHKHKYRIATIVEQVNINIELPLL